MTVQTITLPNTHLTIPALGVGTWQWGDNFWWGYGSDYNRNDLAEAFEASLDAGLSLFDTAELYGLGQSEQILGAFKRSTTRPVVIASKFFPLPWRFTAAQFHLALRGSLKRLGVDTLDLYQVHWPYHILSIPAMMDAMAIAVQRGQIRAVGVSNYSAEQMRAAHAALAQHGIPLASNQVPYHLLDLSYQRNGVLAACSELGVILIAYSPLAQGLLTGKYHTSDARPTGGRNRAKAFRPENLTRIRPLIDQLTALAEQHGKTPAQVALNWLVRQPGVLPIPGAKNARQAASNAGALGWSLTDVEAATLTQQAEALWPAH